MPRELSLAEVFQLGYYWETKILLTAVKLDVFSVLDGRGRTASEAAEKLGADVRALELLLNALVAIRLLSKTGDLYANTPVATTHLVKHGPQYIGHLLLLHDTLSILLKLIERLKYDLLICLVEKSSSVFTLSLALDKLLSSLEIWSWISEHLSQSTSVCSIHILKK